MSLRTDWERRFIFALQQSAITSGVTFDASSQGIVVGQPLLKVTNELSLNPGFGTVIQNKATGQSTRLLGTNGSGEIQVGVSFPVASPELDANANNLALFLWLLFQNGASEAVGSPFVKTYVPYTLGSAETWATIAEVLSTSTAGENRVINGCVVRSITVSGNAGEQSIKVTVELAGGSFAATFDASSAVMADPNIPVLLYKNMTCEIDGNAVYLDSFTFTITNNVTSKPYNSASPQKHILGPLQVTGEIALPKDSGEATLDDNAMLTKFINLTDFTLELYWGNSPATTDGDVAFNFNVVSTDNEEITNENELVNRIPFESANDGTNDISITLADAIDRGIP